MMESLNDMVDVKNDDSGDVAPRVKTKANAKPVVTLRPDIFGDVEVTVQAILGRGSLPVRHLLELAPGGVVELETPLDGQLELMLNGKLIARGELVAVEDRFGIRISEIIAN
jgi:flagellar motor switch protein FliN